MNISIYKTAAEYQRYATWGDWYYEDNGDLTIVVSNDVPELPTDEHQTLVAIHELVESMLCKRRGIPQEQVDTFDMDHPECDEPGDLPTCPYRREHRFAMLIEHMIAHELGITPYGVVA